MLSDSIWVLALIVLAGFAGWMTYRLWRGQRGLIKWLGIALAGTITLLLLTILTFGFLPIPQDVAPIPTLGHTGAPDGAPTTPLIGPAPRTLTVHAGESIQAAIDQAKPGDTVEVAPGVYHEALKVQVDSLTLRGIADSNGEWPVLDGARQLDNAVLGTGNFFTIEQFQIRNYTDNGVKTDNIYGSTYRDLIVTDPGQYGVFPVLSTHVLIQRVKVTGAKDAGIYVGQCRDVIIEDSESFKNNSGIEIESTVDALVQNNYSHENTLGMLIWISPESDVIATQGRNTQVLNNRIENNNAVSIATEDFLRSIPVGIGILVMMADETEIAHNEIANNNSVGVAIAQASIFFEDTSSFHIPLIPEQTWLHDNQYTDNGTHPADFIVQAHYPGADILWDASGWNNRFDDTSAKTFPVLPSSAWPDFLKRALWQIYRLFK